ncbi:glycosyltransferase [Paenibacillus xerothermodurans]|uniref:Glycosyltransferase n=1 Tax=Paenibacillus xerothermodurans TaxID=1977292 RepID=A0A2W1NW82_PAEXE|nr:glycosyltransferase [Paenibacillus xerothermodurans]
MPHIIPDLRVRVHIQSRNRGSVQDKEAHDQSHSDTSATLHATATKPGVRPRRHGKTGSDRHGKIERRVLRCSSLTAGSAPVGKGGGKRRHQQPKRKRPSSSGKSRAARHHSQDISPPRNASAAFEAGFRLGCRDARRFSLEHESCRQKALNRHWLQAWGELGEPDAGWASFVDAAKGYVNGYFRSRRQRSPDWLMLPTARSVAAIVSVMNEEATIGRLLQQLERLPLNEVFVLVNGSTDGSFDSARKHSDAVVVSYPQQLGHDVGRALGAKLAQSDILLYLDGDMVLPAEEMVPFIGGIENGLDVALNDISPYLRVFSRRDEVTRMKQFLNTALGRSDLQANSMTAVPHALSRRAIETLGIASLMVPPKAQALAVHHGLRVDVAGSVDVIKKNKRRKHNTGTRNLVADMIIGDHIEALALIAGMSGARLSFEDVLRNRSYVEGEAVEARQHDSSTQ